MAVLEEFEHCLRGELQAQVVSWLLVGHPSLQDTQRS
jgi:hypothetical protein